MQPVCGGISVGLTSSGDFCDSTMFGGNTGGVNKKNGTSIVFITDGGSGCWLLLLLVVLLIIGGVVLSK